MVSEQLDEEAIFQSARRIDSPDARLEYLDKACGGDQGLLDRVMTLLRTFAESESFLESPPPGIEATVGLNAVSEGPGTVIGPYKLLQQIGEGGMGVVFMAEQSEPIQRTVALKIIKPGMDTRQVIARFDAEQQALAMMDHPNIAKVHDAGMTETGRPYFVMELVSGVSINKYCDDKQLSLRERLELFMPVCQAVQHAHQKGIIHRDLKPTNVLVAEYDNHAIPKVIDFGVAKATAQGLTERTMFTELGQVLGTVEYMSPEQAKLNQLDVDTRSDIYSLGVLLYELLTGSTPFEQKRLREAAFDEVLRIIREEEPPKPSTRLSTGDMLPSIAANRHTEPARLSKEVHGELDWIVMKCLEKDRNRRYETATGLAGDIERFLHDEPVQACPPSKGYRFRKFARRNKTLLAAGGAIATALVIGLGLSMWMYLRERAAVEVAKANETRATTQSAHAKTVSDLLQEMLGSADAARGKGADYRVRELLDDFAAGMGTQLAGQPAVEADIHVTIGRAYRSLNLSEKAQPHFEKAIELRRHMDGPQSEILATTLVDYAWNLQDQQRYVEAASQLKEALEIYHQRGVSGGPLFHALEVLQNVLINDGRDEDAERVTREALDVARHADQEFPDQANLLHRYASFKIRQGHFADAEQLALQSVDMHRRLHGEHHPDTAFGLKTLASALSSQQKLTEAEAAVREALTIFRRQFPEDHPNIRDTIEQLRTVLEARGDKSALETLAKEEAEYAMRSGSPDYHVQLGELLTRPSMAIMRPEDAQRLAMDTASRTEEAHRHIRQAIEGYGRAAINYPYDLDCRLAAAAGLVELSRICAAAPGFADEVAQLNRRLTAELPKLVAAFPDSRKCQWRSAVIYRDWAGTLLPYTTNITVGERALSKSIEILEKLSTSDPKWPNLWLVMADTNITLGETNLRLARAEDAEAKFRRATEIYDRHAAEIAADPTSKVVYRIATNYAYLAYYFAYTHREDEAAKYVRQAVLHAERVTDPVDAVGALCLVALVQLRLGDDAGYRETCKALVDVPIADADELTKMRTITIWCCGPDALADMSLAVQRAKQLVANNSLGQRYIVLYELGTALYRAGQYERAAEQLEASIEAYPSNPQPGFDVINSQRLFLAMTKWQRGQHDEARRLLAETLPDVDKELQAPSSSWSSGLTLVVLRREAVALIGP